DRVSWYRAGAVTGGEEQDVVTSAIEAAGQDIEDAFGPSISSGWDLHPRWSDDDYAHFKILTPTLRVDHEDRNPSCSGLSPLAAAQMGRGTALPDGSGRRHPIPGASAG